MIARRLTSGTPVPGQDDSQGADQAVASPDPSPDRSRRQVLCGVVVALLAPGALAAACGDESGGGTGTTTSTTTTGGGTGTKGGTGGTATTGAGATTTGGGGTGGGSGSGAALAKVNDVPVGGGIIVNGGPNGKVLLVQPTKGTVKAYDPSCTHQGTQVNPPQGGVMTCPNHGSQFNAADGSVKKGPAASPLATVNVKVVGADVVLA